LLTAGWADPAFASIMLRALSRLDVPRIGIFGPWAHRYPHFGIPEPAIGYLQTTLQWLDRWMKGVEAEDANEPHLRSWMPNGFTVAPTPETRAGRWVGETDWPAPSIATRDWWLGPHGLTPAPQATYRAELQSSHCAVSGAGEFMPIFATGANPELPRDQRDDDALSLVFDSVPLSETVEIVGTPIATFELQSDGCEGQIVVRLCEVTPDGTSRRVSWGALNLALTGDRSGRASHEPGVIRSVTVPMFATADGFAAGHCIRIAVSSGYWPMLWPPAKRSRITLETEHCRLSLPVRPPTNGDCKTLPPPEAAPASASRTLRPGGYQVRAFVDDVTSEHVVAISDDMGEICLEGVSLTFAEATRRVFRIRPERPGSAAVEAETSCAFRRKDWAAGTVVRGRVVEVGSTLKAHHRIEATEGDRIVFAREWDSQLPK